MKEEPKGEIDKPSRYAKEHGHTTLAELFAEIRRDEAAAKKEDAHWYGREVFGEGKEAEAKEPEQDRGGLEL
jgi:rubrerythrin